jgi:hypothetical protein
VVGARRRVARARAFRSLPPSSSSHPAPRTPGAPPSTWRGRRARARGTRPWPRRARLGREERGGSAARAPRGAGAASPSSRRPLAAGAPSWRPGAGAARAPGGRRPRRGAMRAAGAPGSTAREPSCPVRARIDAGDARSAPPARQAPSNPNCPRPPLFLPHPRRTTGTRPRGAWRRPPRHGAEGA